MTDAEAKWAIMREGLIAKIERVEKAFGKNTQYGRQQAQPDRDLLELMDNLDQFPSLHLQMLARQVVAV